MNLVGGLEAKHCLSLSCHKTSFTVAGMWSEVPTRRPPHPQSLRTYLCRATDSGLLGLPAKRDTKSSNLTSSATANSNKLPTSHELSPEVFYAFLARSIQDIYGVGDLTGRRLSEEREAGCPIVLVSHVID